MPIQIAIGLWFDSTLDKRPRTFVEIDSIQGFMEFGSSNQPASSSHPQSQQYQDQHPSRGRGISHNAETIALEIS